MGRGEQDSSTVINRSSIALLQERFRQLERVKEMREQRELMRMLAQPKHHEHVHLNLINPTTNMHYDQQQLRLFFHSDLVFPPRSSPPQASLSICPPSQSKHAGYSTGSAGAEAPLSMKSSWRPTDHTPASVLTSLNLFKDFDSDSDVDTSLHL
ncbi:uncharacterized protein LOC121265658 [Juglans microcarpa x Juglans regia]|uniref:uncharacterized protein LOC121265658 n=1 Tax=Juglans microcarpa x Juglans regia TaxID=2249226 RepID=UPI001B7F529C|nr:uncharacterized protein LOC121265658 [Juglans microcarpa x Juglans regia]